ncbi:MAG: hypothetical protein WCQ64_11165 [Acidobacteriota bacterium]
MNDQELRQIVRQALAKNGVVPSPGTRVQSPAFVPESVPFGSHVSHAMYLQLVNSGGSCVIEEHVNCDHCGYCKSHGH